VIYIQIVCLATSFRIGGHPEDGKYIKDFKPDTDERGNGTLVVTPNRAEAKVFADAEEALSFYRQQSIRCPVRDDGQPNLPLTAYTVMFGRD
jgi:hypothetical protein